MKHILTVALSAVTVSIFSGVAHAECTLTRESCSYECIEYYPNGTDCRKTKKVCEQVCVQFEVKKSGDTTEHQHMQQKSDGKK
ncbi:MAG: hypothetical protein L0Y32_00385 [Nevskiales bacterium]|nr:hypothetical protein [Nevskiales bacterium]